MTPLERAAEVVKEFHEYTAGQVTCGTKDLLNAVHAAIIEATNEEVDKRRSLERQMENLRVAGPLVFCEDNRTTLRVWNPKVECWAMTNMIHER